MVLTMSRASSRLSEVALILMILFPDEVDVEILDRRFSRTIRIFSLEGRVSSGVSWGTSESFFRGPQKDREACNDACLCLDIVPSIIHRGFHSQPDHAVPLYFHGR